MSPATSNFFSHRHLVSALRVPRLFAGEKSSLGEMSPCLLPSAPISVEDPMTLLAPRDVGRRWHLSTSRVIQLDREGRLRALRDSAGRRFYLAADVERFAAEREPLARATREVSGG
jgi:hypothetical protein